MIENKVLDIVSKQFGILPTSINLTDHLVNDLGADSLDLVEITMTLEYEFKIAIEDSEADQAQTIQTLIDLICAKSVAT